MEITFLLGLTNSEKWSTGGMTALIGLGMTFLMLALLIGAIILLRCILNVLDKHYPQLKEHFKKISRKKKAEVITPVNTDGIVENDVKRPEKPIEKDTMFAIESAVKKYVSASDDGKPHDQIKILSVKEVSNE